MSTNARSNQVNNAAKETIVIKKAIEVPRGVAILFTLLAIAYLIPEVIFNTRLVSEMASAMSFTDLESIEIFGRAISGIGLSLIIASTYSKWKGTSLYRVVLLVLPISLLIGWPTMYFGQKAIVDAMADKSNAQERQDALMSFAVKNALQIGAVKLSGVDYNPGERDFSDDTFLVFVGGLIYANEEVANKFKRQKDEILSSYFDSRTEKERPFRYTAYEKYRKQVRDKYEEYNKKSNQHLDATSNINTDKEWTKLQSEVYGEWVKYNKYRDGFIFRMNEKIYDLHSAYLDAMHYQNSVLGFKEWLDPTYITTWNGKINGKKLRVTGSYCQAYAVPCLTYKDMFINNSTTFNMHPTHLKDVFIQHDHLAIMFLDEVGYDLSIDSHKKFITDPKTIKFAVEKLNERGVAMPTKWTLFERSIFDSLVTKKTTEQAKSKWGKGMRDASGEYIKPGLTWRQFQLTDLVQDKARKTLGDDYIYPILFEYNDDLFLTKLLRPIMKQREGRARERLSDSLEYFEEDGDLYQDSRNILKAVLVPPISMTISLILIFWSLLNVISGLPSVFPNSRFVSPLERTKVLMVVFLVSLFLAPKYLTPWFYPTISEKANNETISVMMEGLNLPLEKAIDWALHMQPIIQKIGHGMNGAFPIFENFKGSALEHFLKDLDESK